MISTQLTTPTTPDRARSKTQELHPLHATQVLCGSLLASALLSLAVGTALRAWGIRIGGEFLGHVPLFLFAFLFGFLLMPLVGHNRLAIQRERAANLEALGQGRISTRLRIVVVSAAVTSWLIAMAGAIALLAPASDYRLPVIALIAMAVAFPTRARLERFVTRTWPR